MPEPLQPLSPGMVRLAPRSRLLIVDDDPVSLQMVGALLEESHDVTLVGSAQEALELCRTERPDLLLLDILMPDLDGLTACRRLKEDPSTWDIPVIFLTSQATAEEETAALDTGAVDFITKPVNPSVVRARVRTHLILKAQSDFLRDLAFVDGLTGIANRRRFDETLDIEWRRGRRSGTPLSVIMGDIDNFKHYNDHHGHQAGDACLQVVARELRRSLKRAQDLVARYGGEEFVCILPETDAPGARSLAGSLLAAVQALAIPHEGTAPGIVTLSLGVASAVPAGDGGASDLVAIADLQLYKAKAAGRNRFEW
ncbi:MAG TPA: diguanylate cyclase [Holophaga sp.]|nr:diguanylate cyclase [Holophaga sp.]